MKTKLTESDHQAVREALTVKTLDEALSLIPLSGRQLCRRQLPFRRCRRRRTAAHQGGNGDVDREADKNPANERLVAEALRLPEQILTGKTRIEIVQDFLRASPGCAVEKIALWEEGFVTSTGRFVRQVEAALIAKAAGQTLLFGSLVGHPIPHPGT